MAFGFGEKRESSVGNTDNNNNNDIDSKPSFGGNGYYDGFSPAATEEGGRKAAPRKMSRIDQPRTKSISGTLSGREGVDGDESDPDASVAKQMELESGNEIQYRTCSWQKVRLPSIFYVP